MYTLRSPLWKVNVQYKGRSYLTHIFQCLQCYGHIIEKQNPRDESAEAFWPGGRINSKAGSASSMLAALTEGIDAGPGTEC